MREPLVAVIARDSAAPRLLSDADVLDALGAARAGLRPAAAMVISVRDAAATPPRRDPDVRRRRRTARVERRDGVLFQPVLVAT